MSPTEKFNALLSSVTVFVMFFMVAYVGSLLTKAGVDHPALLSVAALVTSLGLYTLLALALRWLMERIEPLRALVLGGHYMHGTWVGWFRDHAGNLHYTVDHLVQDLDSLVVTGRSYTASKEAHAFWISESVAIDAKRGQFIFTYSLNAVTDTNSLSGIHTSLFERKSQRHAPTAFSGFDHDLNDTKRFAVHAQKIANNLLPWEEALGKAIPLFKDV